MPKSTSTQSPCTTSTLKGRGARLPIRAALPALVLLAVASPAHAAALRYWIAPCPSEGECRPADAQLAEWALDAWRAASGGKLQFERATSRDRAHIRILWSGGAEGLYGEARPIVLDGVRGAEVYVLPPSSASYGADILLRDTIVYLTCLHETGHALGLSHTSDFADIMYSFQFGGEIAEYFGRYRRLLHRRADIAHNSGMSPADRRRLLEILH